MKKYILILIFIVESLSAAYMKVTLKNNTYDIYSSCSGASYYTKSHATRSYPPALGANRCDRDYIIELHSKYHIFGNYNGKNEDWHWEFKYSGKDEPVIKISTKLYTITPRVENPNKSDLFLHINEEELKRILQSKQVKIILPITMFTKKLLDKELKRIFPSGNNPYAFPVSHEYTELEPTIILDISNVSFNELKSQCEKNFQKCKTKIEEEHRRAEEERNKPLNRLRRFFYHD